MSRESDALGGLKIFCISLNFFFFKCINLKILYSAVLVSAINDLSTYHTRFQDLCKEILCRGNLLKNKEHVRGVLMIDII